MFTKEELKRASSYCEKHNEKLSMYHCYLEQAMTEVMKMNTYSPKQKETLYSIAEKIFLGKGKLAEEDREYDGFIKYFKGIREGR